MQTAKNLYVEGNAVMTTILQEMVLMVIVSFAPQPDGFLKELWRIENLVTVEYCLKMNQTFARGNPSAVFIVRCDPPDTKRTITEGK